MAHHLGNPLLIVEAPVIAGVHALDVMTFGESALFAGTADGIAGLLTSQEAPAEGVVDYEARRYQNAKRVAVGLRVLGALAAPLVASRFMAARTSKLELLGWAAVGFLRPVLGTGAAMIRGGSR